MNWSLLNRYHSLDKLADIIDTLEQSYIQYRIESDAAGHKIFVPSHQSILAIELSLRA